LSLVDVAVKLELSADGICKEAALILHAVAPVPYRAKTAERALIGRRVGEEVAREAGYVALDGATPLDKNAYKLPLFEILVRPRSCGLWRASDPQTDRVNAENGSDDENAAVPGAQEPKGSPLPTVTSDN
jgi:hypothetical protein